VAVVISLKLVYTPVDDTVTAPHKSQVTSHKHKHKLLRRVPDRREPGETQP
jgi:hypothetical protein